MLGASVMGVAVVTLMIYHEWLHAVFPSLIFVTLAAKLTSDVQRSQQPSI